MSNPIDNQATISHEELRAMHTVYRTGGKERLLAPHVIYHDEECPHFDCHQRLHGIDFQLETYGKDIHDPLVRAWWDDTGFAGRCPSCQGWIHFTIQSKSALTEEEAADLPKLPDDWYSKALVL